jgi:hypothetical protein
MTKAEAIQAMKEGKKVTHHLFSPDEWMTMRCDGEKGECRYQCALTFFAF